jgi:hypothetical protein
MAGRRGVRLERVRGQRKKRIPCCARNDNLEAVRPIEEGSMAGWRRVVGWLDMRAGRKPGGYIYGRRRWSGRGPGGSGLLDDGGRRSRSLTSIRKRRDRVRDDRGGDWRRGGLRGRNCTGLKTGHYRCLSRGLIGGGGDWEEVIVVAVDGIGDGVAPAVGAEGVDVFVLGEADGLEKSLGEVGDGAGGSGFYIAANDSRDQARQGGAEIVGGEVVAGEEVGQVFADGFCGASAGFFLGVIEAEMGMVAGARGTAAAAIGERE